MSSCLSGLSVKANPFQDISSLPPIFFVLLLTVIRLSLRRRLVNLLPVSQRTNALTNGVIDRPWVVGREFESHVHHENAF